eukprot:gene1367-997_t
MSGKGSGYIAPCGYIAIQRAAIKPDSKLVGESLILDINAVKKSSLDEIPEKYVAIDREHGNANPYATNDIIFIIQPVTAIGLCNVGYEASLLDRIPTKDYKHLSLPEDALPAFMFPHGLRLELCDRNQYPLPSFFTFVFTDQDGKHLYVACLKFYEDVPKEDLMAGFRQLWGDDEIHTAQGPEISKKYIQSMHLQYPLLKGTYVIDLVSNSIHQFNGKYVEPCTNLESIAKSLPSAPKLRLRARLLKITDDFRIGPQLDELEEIDSAFDFQSQSMSDYPPRDWTKFPTLTVRDAFMSFMADLLGDYTAFIIPPVEDLSADTYRTFREEFMVDEYMNHADVHCRPVLELLMETQMFSTTWRTVLVACAAAGGDSMRRISALVFKTMQQSGLVPNALTYGQYIKAIGAKRDAVDGAALAIDDVGREVDAFYFMEEIGFSWYSYKVQESFSMGGAFGGGGQPRSEALLPTTTPTKGSSSGSETAAKTPHKSAYSRDSQLSPLPEQEDEDDHVHKDHHVATDDGLHSSHRDDDHDHDEHSADVDAEAEAEEAEEEEDETWTLDKVQEQILSSLQAATMERRVGLGVRCECVCDCGISMMFEEIMARWCHGNSIDVHRPANARLSVSKTSFNADMGILCTHCQKSLSPTLCVTQYEATVDPAAGAAGAAAEAAAGGAALPTLQRGWDEEVTMMSPFVMQFEYEELLLKVGELAQNGYWLHENHPAIYWNLLWYSGRFHVPSGLSFPTHTASSTSSTEAATTPTTPSASTTTTQTTLLPSPSEKRAAAAMAVSKDYFYRSQHRRITADERLRDLPSPLVLGWLPSVVEKKMQRLLQGLPADIVKARIVYTRLLILGVHFAHMPVYDATKTGLLRDYTKDINFDKIFLDAIKCVMSPVDFQSMGIGEAALMSCTTNNTANTVRAMIGVLP